MTTLTRFKDGLKAKWPCLALYEDDDRGQDRAQADQGMEQWYADRDAQDEFRSWLDVLNEQSER